MEAFSSFFESIYEMVGPGIFIVLAIVLFIGTIAQWALYVKCRQPGLACIVPIWNVIVFMRIVGRPPSHAWYLLIPLYNIYFVCKVWIELCQCFGRYSTFEYTMAILLNGLYVLNLGLSYEAEYQGPVYQSKKAAESDLVVEPQLA